MTPVMNTKETNTGSHVMQTFCRDTDDKVLDNRDVRFIWFVYECVSYVPGYQIWL